MSFKNPHRQWLYHKSETARIFEAGETVEEGWFDSPRLIHPLEDLGPVLTEDFSDVNPELQEEESDEEFVCEFCGETYKSESWYRRHLKSKHKDMVL
jgi:hypothetical protein